MKKILIVDDQIEISRLLEVVLRGEGRQLFFAFSGGEAVEAARREVPDLILLDVMMPGGLDGYEVARILKADPQTRHCRIIAVTAKVQNRDRHHAFAAGVDDYIVKPFDVLALQRKVADLLR